MAVCGEYIRSQFPTIDDDLYQYVEGILDSSKDDFEDGDEVYEAIGEVLHEVAEKPENEVRQICVKLLEMLKGNSNDGNVERRKNGVNKVLNAPVHLGTMAATLEAQVEQIKSIWVTTRDDAMKVDAKKLEKAEAKLQQKQEKRSNNELSGRINIVSQGIESASASQMTSKKDSRMETKGGVNKAQDIRIENFDIAYGDRILLQGADLTLAFGRRYGLIGRNGLGKTTLLRMISSKQLRIPSHIRVLHVEQEVAGDDTSALESVLECDQERSMLLSKETELQVAIEKDGGKTGDALGEELARVYEAMQLAEVDKAPARASAILSGLGFSVERQSWPTKAFSGGWRMRLALARALFSRPDLLLLDEPTNMLDIKAILWLEKYLQSWPTTLLVVSHDRNFLDTVPTDILYLRGQKIEAYRGNYEQFAKTKGERERNQQREYEAQQAKRAHVQEFIDRFRYNANRASSVQSKIKMLEKLPELKPMEKEGEVTLRFPDVEPLSPPILQLNEVSFSYTGGVDNSYIFSGVNLTASLQSRICIVGENGAGKTTLLKIITGALSPTRGTVHVHRNLKFGYFSQHHVDQLDMRVCPVELLQNHFPGKPVEEYRRMLGSFGISGNLALQTISSLSGGQKSRVAFALMCAAMPNFLVLDEPTNHLDIESIEALGKALNTCQAGVILVSHDERLIRMVCTELWVCGEGSVRCIEGGFDEYRRIIEKELEV
ncbi:ATP-binding cassette sub-family F member 3 isoform X1 [Bombus vosnesenskii]|uniref:ATP-binding cassette sub-family F member 3 n=3 Tax=Pyrobombus TaxID=144703 RepID=A0A6J3KQA2_9HYME|nr:ATP-binding cassette sub-family F member 3 isoform X1 [Bombus impatiens]XP_033320090.1 ATP-binding cassette sub-family F member 3 isoform X1 [Bombus bifarius]XP_033355312.1 ATP-binding cassette sub-family F member 3 isoform X1 [Bombus vosnesenskii]XP_043602903.1 ATP-binding cassette sub-family F member 3 isoform X1 [Bombus pyrosoma]XP_050492049.1 ATP-binding cassette sub-family F member 3 isoform X1 [Bombus huntii]